MGSGPRLVSTVDTAKLIRRELKEAFPAVRFSVRCRYSAWEGYIDVEWTDGPQKQHVEAITQRYESKTSEYFHYDLVAVDRPPQTLVHEDGTEEEVVFGAARVHVTRWYSDAWEAQLQEEIAAFTGEPYRPDRAYAISVNGAGDDAALVRSSSTELGRRVLHYLAQRRTGPTRSRARYE